MHEAVSELLVHRAQDADGFLRMVTFSLVAHAALIAGIYFMPPSWRSTHVDPNAPIMTITLGGTPGPDAGGMTSISGRPVQEVAPPEAKPVRQPAPAARTPEMVLPDPVAKPAAKTPAKPVEKPAEKSASRKPATGAEVKPGAAVVDTGGAPTPFPGLTTGGGGSGGARVDVQNFCCPEYLMTMNQLIQKNWNQNQGLSGAVDVKFTIQRNGMLTAVAIDKPSGMFQLDQEALRAVLKTRTLPPLPREFTNPTLTVYLTFEYKR